MRPDVAVVITTHNRRSMLPDAVASVRGQTGVEWELIVVDDGSTDGTPAWLGDELSPPSERFTLRPASGRPAAANAALPLVRARYVLFLDDDDELLPGALAELAAALDATPEASVAIGARLRKGRRIAHPARRIVHDASVDLIGSWGPVPGQSLMRTELVREAGGFPDVFPADDLALFLRMAERGPFVFVPDAVLRYRVHGEQSRKPSDLQAIRGRLSAEAMPGHHLAWAAGQRRRRAERAREDGRPVRAITLYAASALTSPAVTRSPLIWPALAHGVVDSGRQLLARR